MNTLQKVPSVNSSYIDDNESGLSVDVEGVSDSATHSKLALFSLLPLLIGVLAPIEYRLAFFSGLAVLMSTLALFLARREPISGMTRNVASFVVLIGTLTAVWGITNFQQERSRLFHKATEVAREYLDVLGDGNMLRAIQMVGLDPVVQDIDGEAAESNPSQRAVREYLNNETLKQIVKRGKEVDWVAQQIVNYRKTLGEHQFIVRFLDKSRSNQAPMDVIVLFSPPTKYAPEKIDRWMIDGVEEVK
jgi:hypothetical protein